MILWRAMKNDAERELPTAIEEAFVPERAKPTKHSNKLNKFDYYACNAVCC